MHLKRDHLTASALVAAVALAGFAFAAPPVNDPCANASAIVGSGAFPFDLTEATFGGNGAFSRQCDGAGAGIDHDVWYCWTSTCNGLVEFSTCGGTQVDTKIRIYAGCACPSDVANPICCSDDDCGKQTRVVCDAVCGETYLIQLGTKAGAPGGPGTLTINCLEENCGGGEPPAIVCGCCGARPPLVDSISTPFNPGAVAAGTNYRVDPNDPAFYLLDLGNQGSAPIGTNTSWPTNRYADPSWSMAKLGAVFGVTISDVGDIFVAHTAVYGDYANDLLGGLGGAGSIYHIDGSTGTPTEFIRLPNQLDGSLPANQQYPGLGQLDFDCNNGRLFASNFDDGRIYSIDAAGAIQSTFDHATGTVTGPLSGTAVPEAGDPKGFEPLGTRVWAVRGTGGRLFYSLWVEDSGRPNPTADNQIWSVALTATGDFVPGSSQLEFNLPPLFVGDTFSNPVADIDFDDNCCMLVGERGMFDDTSTTPHQGRVLRYCYDPAAASWSLDPTQFSIGFAGQNNCVGGVAWEGAPNNLVWGFGDAIYLGAGNQIYGFTGIPTTGGDLTNSILLDLDGDLSFQQKDELGSIELTCAEAPCASVVDGEILCEADGTFEYTFTVTNTSGQTVAAIILPDPGTSPNVLPLNPPLANGASQTFTVTITGQQPGTEYCFEMIFGSVEGNECCHIEHCVQLPDCECAQTSHVNVQATSTPGIFNVSFSITNLENWNMGHISLFPAGTTGSLAPSLWNFAGLPQFGTQVIGPITVNSGMSPGDTFCITIGQHSDNWLQCCFIELCIDVPNPAPSCHPADLNCDGHIDAADLAILLGAWGSAGPGDLNADGQVNAADLAILLGAWGS
jgi:hypothetical protein